MAKKYLKINSVSNDEGNDLFNAICKDILLKSPNDVRESLGLPANRRVTMKDAITLIQEEKIECEVIVKYTDKGGGDEDLPFK